jgi:hypothetical protein
MQLVTKWRTFTAALVLGGALLYGYQPAPVVASDHDDGETNIKSRNLSLTDLYVFREDWQTGDAADAGNLVMVMNTNPRSLPRQQYFFNTEAIYSFHIGRQSDPDNQVTGRTDLRIDFRFAPPAANGQQDFTMEFVSVANELPTNQITVAGGKTTPAAPLIGDPNPAPVVNNFTGPNGNVISVFAGLREDPFFFDVQAFFKVRAALAGAGPAAAFGDLDTAEDFAKDYNVNSIVVRMPIALLSANGETTFDVWETINLPNELAARQ